MNLVSVQQLIDHMSDIDLTAEQQRAARVVLDGVEGEVRRFLNRPILPLEVTEQSVRVDPESGMLLTRHSPVLSLISPLDGTVTLEDARLYGWGSAGPVTYTAGLLPDDLATVKLQVLRIAAREMQNKHDDVQGNSGIGDGEDAPAVAEGMQQEDRDRLRGLRKRVLIR